LIENDFADQIYSYLRKFVDVIVQLSVVFDLDLFKRLSHQLVDRIECLSNAFDDEISEIVAVNQEKILLIHRFLVTQTANLCITKRISV
jgi:hypothetical protein